MSPAAAFEGSQSEAAKCCTFVNHGREVEAATLETVCRYRQPSTRGSASSSYRDSAARDYRGADVTGRRRAWKRYERLTFVEWLAAIGWAALAALVVVFSLIVVGGFLTWLTSPTVG